MIGNMDNYEVDGQMDLEECLWAMGYYMPLSIEENDDEQAM